MRSAGGNCLDDSKDEHIVMEETSFVLTKILKRAIEAFTRLSLMRRTSFNVGFAQVGRRIAS